MPTFHEHPHGIRDVLYAHDPEAAERATEAKAEEIEQALDAAVGRGAITTDDRFDRRNRLRREPELVAEVLASLPGDRDSADQAALRDLRLINLRRDWHDFVGVEEEVRAFDETIGLTESERLYGKLAEATNERLFA